MNTQHRHAGLRAVALVGILIGFALRLHRLGAESLWYDETVSAYLSRLSPGALVAHTAGDIHPPGYYLLLHLWRLLAQPTLHTGLEFGLAWVSLFWGMLIVVLVMALGTKLFDRRIGVAALWFAALNPFHLWYSQEVRMYTQGAALGLLCLWFILGWLDDTRRVRPLIAYALTAAAGLYTLYYFGFLLLGLALVTVLALWDRTRPGTRLAAGGRWAVAQVGVLLLYAPWLPVLWRQATDPPVPPWRAPWTSVTAVLMPINESLAALVAGQSPPLERLWPWAAAAAFLATLAVVLPVRRHARRRAWHSGLLLLFVAVPLLLIMAVTLLGTPLYHVRYGFAYAPAFAIVAAVSVDELWRVRRWLGVGVAGALVLTALAADAEFWTNQRYIADDHRGAVANLAAQWRPGDAILVNAGWAYTALDTYWPVQTDGPLGSAPPPMDRRLRLTDYASRLQSGELTPLMTDTDTPWPVTVLQTGSVDGPPSLGWGDPQSDFYAMPAPDTIAALETVSAHHPRLWHYRVYDTVSDPTGVIRTWLDEQTTQLADTLHPGRDFLRTQLFLTDAPLPDDLAHAQNGLRVGDALTLVAPDRLTPTPAGSMLYTELVWRVADDAAPLPDLRMSLRLVAQDGTLAVQTDGPPQPPSTAWQPGQDVRQPLAIAVPAALPPGEYTLELVTYAAETGAPLPVAAGPQTVDGQRVRLGTVQVEPAVQAVPMPRPQARFDYIELVDVSPTAAVRAPGDTLDMALVWRPRPSAYSDTYDAVFELRRGDELVHSWRGPVGGAYPSGAWIPERPVLEQRRLPLPATLAPGDYALTMRLERASDGLAIPARVGLWPRNQAAIDIAAITVRD